ncbi:MAG: hypothetical protein ACP5SI_11970, partial [Chloroflexia bacterium]
MSQRFRSSRAVGLAGLLLVAGVLFPRLASLGRPAVRTPSAVERGERALGEGRFFRAEIAFRQALFSPEGDRALGRLGQLALLRGEEQEAQERLRAAVQLHPEDANSWACLGWLEWKRGERTLAEEAWRQGLSVRGHFLVHALRGEAAYQSRAMAEARQEFASLLADSAPPDWQAWAHLRLGTLDAYADPASALAHWRAALKAGPVGGETWSPPPELIFRKPSGET